MNPSFYSALAVSVSLALATSAAASPPISANDRVNIPEITDASVGAAGPGVADPRGEQKRHREARDSIVKKWAAHVKEAYSMSAEQWDREMDAVFRVASPDTLERAAKARTFTAMDDIVLQALKASPTDAQSQPKSKADAAKLLGETTSDLVFVPITPCRIFDTRLAGGQIAANTVRNFDVNAVSDYSFQGGDASNCSGAGAAGSFAAAAINFTVVTPASVGYITAFPFLGTQPVATTLNYKAGDVLSNFSVVKLDQGASANELSVYSFAQTHVVGDLMGYFINPVLGEIECVETSSSNITVNAGSFATGSSPACAAGYTIMSGGCTMTTFDGRIVSSRSFSGTNTHFCAFRNENASTANTGVAYGRCCKLPSGRPAP